MADDDDGAALVAEPVEAFEAASLEGVVADGQYLVDEQDLGFDVDGHGEAEAYVHARGVVAYGFVDELVQFGEADDVVEALADVAGGESQDGAVEVDVLAAGEFGVEAGAQFQQC